MNAIDRLGAQIDQNLPIEQMHTLMEENVRMAQALKAIIEYEKTKAIATQKDEPSLSVLLGPPARIAIQALLGTTHGNS